MKVTLKYDQGIKANEVVGLEIPAQEFEQMIENDYQFRLADAKEDEVVERRTPQEILDEMNRAEYNSWQTHNKRHTVGVSSIQEENVFEMVDLFEDWSQMEAQERQEDYEEQCQRIRNEFKLKPDQADMMIAICLDGMLVKEYAELINEDQWVVYKRFNRIKERQRKVLY